MPKKPLDLTVSTQFRFCGNGLCIPGLPHELTAAQAQALGLLDELNAAVENGVYKAIPTIHPAAPVEIP